MGREYGTHGSGLKGRNHSEEIGVGGMVILE